MNPEQLAAHVEAGEMPAELKHNKPLCADCTTDHACRNRLDVPRPCSEEAGEMEAAKGGERG